MGKKNSIRLAYLISEYPATSHTFILREILELRKLGLEIYVASINESNLPKDKLPEEEKKEIEHTFYVKKKGILEAISSLLTTSITSPLSFFRGLVFSLKIGGWDLKHLLYNLFYFIEALIIGRWMQRKGIHHLHVHFANSASTVALILSKTFPYTHSITVHGPDIFDDISLNKLQKKIESVKFICCIGYFSRSQLMRISPTSMWNKIEVSPLGVNTSIFRPRLFSEKPSPYEILSVGRLAPSKGQHILLQACEILQQKGKEVRLRLVGDGPNMQSLKLEATKCGLDSRVIFEGALNQPEVIELYKTADIFALSSFAEGIPVVLMEAMAMEIPCVATQIMGIPELIRDRVDGMLVRPSDANALANALEELIDNPELRQQLGKAGRERITKKYNLETNTKKLAKIFTNHLSS